MGSCKYRSHFDQKVLVCLICFGWCLLFPGWFFLKNDYIIMLHSSASVTYYCLFICAPDKPSGRRSELQLLPLNSADSLLLVGDCEILWTQFQQAGRRFTLLDLLLGTGCHNWVEVDPSALGVSPQLLQPQTSLQLHVVIFVINYISFSAWSSKRLWKMIFFFLK